LIFIHPLTLLIQLLSSKQLAYCPSWERKKNASRERFSDEVRLKMAENATERMQRRTRDKTRVERTEKTKTDLN
jgi:nicotinic acid mononucleotide adenylyltransferase